MKRFIDLRGQGTGMRFAWWDTVLDRFECHSNEYAWDTWEEFLNDHEGDDFLRYKCLCPEWAFIEIEEDEDEFLQDFYNKLHEARARADIALYKLKKYQLIL